MREECRPALRLGKLVRGRGGGEPRTLEYAAIDIATTGTDPRAGARICEIAIVRMRGDGTVLGEFTTLVDPRRPITRQELHGIGAADTTGAPMASAVTGNVAEMLSGAVVVGHGLDATARFLAAEFGEVCDGLPALCTLRTLRAHVELRHYSLPRASYVLGGRWPTGQHTALGTARASAWLLAELVHNAPGELHYVGPRLFPLAAPARAERIKPRRLVEAVSPSPETGERVAPSFPLRTWPALWRPIELDHALCGGRFTPVERDRAVAAARRRQRFCEALATAAGLTVGTAMAAAVREVMARSRAPRAPWGR